MWHRIEGVGLPNVFLKNGYTVEGEGDRETVSYVALDDLYRAIGEAVSHRAAPLTGQELKFLRRRLDLSQQEAGAILGKTSQAVAKWEKGITSVPIADGSLMRLAWLATFSRHGISRYVDMLVRAGDFVAGDYAFSFAGKQWADVSHQLFQQNIQQAHTEAAAVLGRISQLKSGYTVEATSNSMLREPLHPQKEITT